MPLTAGVRQLVLIFLCTVGCGCSGTTVAPLPLAKVDLTRIYGGWYIIATIPNWFEKGAVQPYDVYAARSDGDIREDFYVRFGGFDARCKHYTVHDWVIADTDNAMWRVRPIWPVQVPFLVGYVDPDYRFVIFGENNRKLGWIYAREPIIGDTDYAALEGHLRKLGYDPAKFKRFLQLPEQYGQPGFWTDKVQNVGIAAPRCS